MCNYPSFHFSRKMWPQHPGSLSSFTTAHPSFFSLIWRQEKHLTFACKKHEASSKWRVVGEEKLKGAEFHWVQRTQRADQLFNSGAWSLICMFLMAWRHSSRSSPQHLPEWTTGAWVWYPWWLTERKPWFMPCLLLAYSCLSEGGSVMSKPSWRSRFWTYWFGSIGSALCARQHQTCLEHACHN